MKTKQAATRYLANLLTESRGLGLFSGTVEISAHAGDPADSPEHNWDGYARAVIPRNMDSWKADNGIASNLVASSFGINRSRSKHDVAWYGIWIDGEMQQRAQLSEVLEVAPNVRLDIEPGNIVLIEE